MAEDERLRLEYDRAVSVFRDLTDIRFSSSRRIGGLEGELLGGPIVSARPERAPRLFGVIGLEHSLGLALVYGAALAGWGYLVAWGALAALDVGHARDIGVIIGAAWGLLVLQQVLRLDRPE